MTRPGNETSVVLLIQVTPIDRVSNVAPSILDRAKYLFNSWAQFHGATFYLIWWPKVVLLGSVA